MGLWEEIFANHLSDKGFVSRTYKELLHSAIKRQPTLKAGKDLNRQFSKKVIQMANKHVKRCSTFHQGNANQNYKEILLYIHQDGQNKKDRCSVISVGKDIEKSEPSNTADGNVKRHSHFGKLAVPQKVKCSVTI